MQIFCNIMHFYNQRAQALKKDTQTWSASSPLAIVVWPHSLRRPWGSPPQTECTGSPSHSSSVSLSPSCRASSWKNNKYPIQHTRQFKSISGCRCRECNNWGDFIQSWDNNNNYWWKKVNSSWLKGSCECQGFVVFTKTFFYSVFTFIEA